MNLENYNPEDYVITRFEKPVNWSIDESNKTNYFSKKFKLVKRVLGYSDTSLNLSAIQNKKIS